MSAVMERDVDAAHEVAERVNELLRMWHAWSAAEAVGYGFPSTSAACRQARASRQYDDENGSLDAYVDVCLCEAVDAVMDALPLLERAALSTQARNLASRVQVWRNPRLPADPHARAQLLKRAREMFVARLVGAGLI